MWTRAGAGACQIRSSFRSRRHRATIGFGLPSRRSSATGTNQQQVARPLGQHPLKHGPLRPDHPVHRGCIGRLKIHRHDSVGSFRTVEGLLQTVGLPSRHTRNRRNRSPDSPDFAAYRNHRPAGRATCVLLQHNFRAKDAAQKNARTFVRAFENRSIGVHAAHKPRSTLTSRCTGLATPS